ncbi:DUF2332 domain-containing protein [Jannaschia sp. CCS1]|uniref:DUF2332 domain-containing protein n=1 Tax=Jannaschia sp. (strain CCS1) TaxID=290400 RepID=UPI000053B4BC|nr:DUF2332 domain-containing protein [Jannaschia sp. CCS1]ABD56508.1 hypothetical protein Jann_3591 [Jannaschia sp. CCS1]
MSARLRAAFASQGRATAKLGSPFMARLMPLIGQNLDDSTAVGHRCLAWDGDVSAAGQSVPLRLAGALHGLVLDGTDARLTAAYPPNTVDDDTLWQAVLESLTTHEARIMDWLDRPPQTNEVRRAAAVIAGIWWALGQVGQTPVILTELGASAGLNLSLDRFALSMGRGLHVAPQSSVRLKPDWTGPFVRPHPIHVTTRAGVDLSPLDPKDPTDALRLLAYIWPDQPERMARTRAAIALSDTRVDADDAAPWLAQRLADPWVGLHVVYTTIAAQYFSAKTVRDIAENLATHGANATPKAPLLHLAMEADDVRRGAALTASLWAGGPPVVTTLARVDFHGAWIEWQNGLSPDGPMGLG